MFNFDYFTKEDTKEHQNNMMQIGQKFLTIHIEYR